MSYIMTLSVFRQYVKYKFSIQKVTDLVLIFAMTLKNKNKQKSVSITTTKT